MKVLMLSPFFHPRIGGVEKHVKKVAEALTDRGHTVSVITKKHGADLPDTEDIDGNTVYRITAVDGSKMKYEIWKWFFKNRHLLKEADIIHCHDNFIWHLPFRFLYPSKKVFITFHGYEGYPVSKKAVKVRKISEKLTMGNICVGRFIEKWYGTKASAIIYGGVDKEFFESAGAEVEEWDAVFIGRLAEDTGILQYLQGFHLAQKTAHKELRFIICGDGPLRENVESYARQNNLDVTLKGFVTNPDYYLKRSKTAFVSGYLAILEAFACRKPVISVYDNDLKKDYLESVPQWGDMMYVAHSPVEIRDYLLECITPGSPGLKKVDRAFTWAKNQTWDKVARIYESLWLKS